MESQTQSRPPRRWLRIVLIQLILWPTLLGIAEGGFRFGRWLSDEPYSAEATATEIEGLIDRGVNYIREIEREYAVNEPSHEMAVRLMHPFLGWETEGGRAHVQDLRRQQRQQPEGETYTIMILGGSVAQIFGQYGTFRLTQLLNEDPRLKGHEIRYMKLGEGGYKQPQQVNLLTNMLALGLEPDAVINIDGYNELALSSRNGDFDVHPSYPSLSHWGALVTNPSSDPDMLELALDVREQKDALADLGERARKFPISSSAILSTLVLRRMKALNARRVKASDALALYMADQAKNSVPTGPRALPADTYESAIDVAWAECSRSMQGICSARGILYLHALQPTLHDTGSKPLAPEEQKIADRQKPPWLNSVTLGYPRFRELGAKLAQEGVNFIDTSDTFKSSEESLYFDNCHFNGMGNRRLAKRIGTALLEKLE